MPYTDTNVSNLIINVLTSEEYSDLQEGGQLSESQLYMITDDNLTPYTSEPNMDGTASAGSSTSYSRGDHTHPTDTSRAPVASPNFTGTPTAPTATAGTSSTQIATTEFVQNAVGAAGGGTVTSVRVRATSPVVSSVNTEQTTSLDTTISLSNGYGDTKNPYAAKNANKVLAGPTSGSDAAPSFRALVADDIPSITKSKISDFPTEMTPTSHSHGNITNGGDITTTATIANGDRLVINDESASKVTNSSITFGTGTSTFLANNGTWQTPSYPVTSVNTQTGAVVLDADDISYDNTYSVKEKIEDIITTGGEPNVIEVVEVNGTPLTVTNKTVDVPVPTDAVSNTTGISIADHSTTSIYGVSSTTTTASKVTLGTAFSVPNVTSVGSAATWEFENVTVPIKNTSATTVPIKNTSATTVPVKNTSATSIPNVTNVGSGSFTQGTDSFTPASLATGFYSAGTSASFTRGTFTGGSFTQGSDTFTANKPTVIDVTKFNGGSFTRGSFSGGSFTRGSFSGGSLSVTNDTTTDPDHHILTFTFTPATHAADSFTAATHGNDTFTAASLASGFYSAGTSASFTQGTDSFTSATHAADSFTANKPTVIDTSKFNGGSFTQGTDTHTHVAPTLGTAISLIGVQSTTTSVFGVQSTTTSVTGVQSSTATASHVKSGGNGTAPTLGTAISIPNVTAATDVTVPIKNSSSTTVVTGKTHSITDNGHTHTLSVPEE